MRLLHRNEAAVEDRTIDRDQRVKVRERTWTFAPGQLISMIAGILVIIMGLVAIIRAGLDGSLDDPVVQVLGWDHTAWLGLGELGAGVLLVLVGTGAWGRPLSVLLGVLGVIAGVVILAEPGSAPDELAVERDFGWPLVIGGAIVALAAMVMPIWRSHTTATDADTIELRDRRPASPEPDVAVEGRHADHPDVEAEGADDRTAYS